MTWKGDKEEASQFVHNVWRPWSEDVPPELVVGLERLFARLRVHLESPKAIALDLRERKPAAQPQPPSVGRIVHYWPEPLEREHWRGCSPVPRDDEPIVASIVSVREGACWLFLHLQGPEVVEAPFAEDPREGHWSWPPRV